MLKFFRNIRRRLLRSNKIGAYALYGVGEIILVVIGILIALQINNQNEVRKERVEEEKILLGIKEDFIETRKRLKVAIQEQEQVLSWSLLLINKIEHNEQKRDEQQFLIGSIRSYLNRGALGFIRAEPITGTYDALIGAGKLSIIQNRELLKALAEFSSVSKLPFEDEERSMNLGNLMEERIGDYPALTVDGRANKIVGFSYFYSEEEIRKEIKQLFQNKPFLTHLKRRYIIEGHRLDRHKSLLSATNRVLAYFEIEDLPFEKDSYAKYLGSYEDTASEEVIQITNEGLRLFAQASNIPPMRAPVEMVFFEKNHFYINNPFNCKIRFREENGNINGMTFYNNGNEGQFRKRN